MKLYFRKFGVGRPLVVLHGVFGSSDNLFTISKLIADHGFAVYTLDARNHGQSPRGEVFNYEAMAADLDEFLTDNNLEKPILLGHSMGGKTVMQYAVNFNNYSKVIIVDIAPKFYPTHHKHITDALNAVDLKSLESRKDATTVFNRYVSDSAEQQFLLKNLYRTPEGGFDWRVNVPVLTKEIHNVGEELATSRIIEKPALFIRGGDSPYISDEDIPTIKSTFPNAKIVTIDGANHWVHATKPAEFVDTVVAFID